MHIEKDKGIVDRLSGEHVERAYVKESNTPKVPVDAGRWFQSAVVLTLTLIMGPGNAAKLWLWLFWSLDDLRKENGQKNILIKKDGKPASKSPEFEGLPSKSI